MSNSQFQEIKKQVLEANPIKAELMAYGDGIGAPVKASMKKNEMANAITTFLIEQRMGTEAPVETSDSDPVEENQTTLAGEIRDDGEEDTLSEMVEKENAVYEQPSIRHLVRLLVPDRAFSLTGDTAMTAIQIQEFVAKEFFQQGYNLKFAKRLGAEEAGHNILFVFEDSGDDEQHSEFIIKLQAISNSLSGFQADDWISSYVDDGWELFEVEGIGWTEAGVNVLWILVR